MQEVSSTGSGDIDDFIDIESFNRTRVTPRMKFFENLNDGVDEKMRNLSNANLSSSVRKEVDGSTSIFYERDADDSSDLLNDGRILDDLNKTFTEEDKSVHRATSNKDSTVLNKSKWLINSHNMLEKDGRVDNIIKNSDNSFLKTRSEMLSMWNDFGIDDDDSSQWTENSEISSIDGKQKRVRMKSENLNMEILNRNSLNSTNNKFVKCSSEKKTEWRKKLTMPQPFMFLRKSSSKTNQYKKTKAMIELDEKRKKKEDEDTLECSKQFKANPLPKFLKKSSSIKVVCESLNRNKVDHNDVSASTPKCSVTRRYSHDYTRDGQNNFASGQKLKFKRTESKTEHNKTITNNNNCANNVLNRSSYKNFNNNNSKVSTCNSFNKSSPGNKIIIENDTSFKAQPFPTKLFNKSIDEQSIKQERRMKLMTRAEMLKGAKLPSSMQARKNTTNKQEGLPNEARLASQCYSYTSDIHNYFGCSIPGEEGEDKDGVVDSSGKNSINVKVVRATKSFNIKKPSSISSTKSSTSSSMASNYSPPSSLSSSSCLDETIDDKIRINKLKLDAYNQKLTVYIKQLEKEAAIVPL
ncbi:hypothetical protein HELRODRAFT_160466 [Helobdella robusta]|uniref:Uncharacterized protein n=1 Tax=Helobdella robusta TaxID=6412 RepID=T1EQA2_HELRO|nr:hypothetical protein HELRODRAFT_160466 [Helobdella robusta]ESO06302.1 hypothetical protein HELRODRAFT_160466 [Helobdella robusta]